MINRKLAAYMYKTKLNKTKSTLRYLFAFIAMVLVLFSSCAVKGGIKSLVDLPVKSEHSSAKKASLYFGNSQETCAQYEIADTKIVQSVSASATDLLPIAVFTAFVVFFFGDTLRKQKEHPRYCSLKIPGSLPIFLQHRKLII